MSHIIRLRGPWNVAAIHASGATHETTIELPLAPELWPEGNALVLRRRFGRPSGIEPGDRLFLVFSGGCRSSMIRLNGSEINATLHENALACDVTQMLEARNTIEYMVDRPSLPFTTFEVRLEIRSAGNA